LGRLASDPNGGQVDVPVSARVSTITADIEGRYYFIGKMQRRDTLWGLYGLLGATFAYIQESRSYDKAEYVLDSSEGAGSSTSGFAIHLGLGAQVNLNPILLGAWVGLGLPANKVNDEAVEVTFPAFGMAHVGAEYSF
jgi:hypothetical protein